MPHPLVEHVAEERTVRFRRNGIGRNPPVRRAAHDRQELYPARAEIAQRAVNGKRLPCRVRGDGAEQIGPDAAAQQPPRRRDRALPASPSARLRAKGVVQLRRAVKAQADVKPLRREEIAPVVVEQNAVRLQAVPAGKARGQVFLLQRSCPAVKIEAGQRRLAAVPGERDDGPGAALHVIADERLQRFLTHAAFGGLAEARIRAEIIAVAAAEVAARPHRLNHEHKGGGGLPPLRVFRRHVRRCFSRKAKTFSWESMACSRLYSWLK